MSRTKKTAKAVYSTYKDSGVDWLGEVPAHWEVVKMSWCFLKIGSGTTPSSSSEQYYLNGRTNWLLTGDLNDAEIHETTKKVTSAAMRDHSALKVYPENSVVIAMYGATIGKLGIVKIPTTVNQACCVFSEPINVLEKYVFYALMSARKELIHMSYGGGQPNINQEILKQFKIPIPPLPEQRRIADYLDQKCAQIDLAIAQKERMIALLEERQQIVIQRAVSQGLDSGVAMKDSGVACLGEIPEHWELKKLRYVFSFGKGLTITKENLREEGIKCINYGEIHSKYGFEVNTEKHALKCVDESYLEKNIKSLLQKGDFIFADTSEDIEGAGNFSHLSNDDQVFAGYHTVTAKSLIAINSRFCAYVFDSVSFRNQIRSRVKGVKVYSITQTILKEPYVWYPPLSEQERIAKHLDEVVSKTARAVLDQRKGIKALREYREVLIDEVVRGRMCLGE